MAKGLWPVINVDNVQKSVEFYKGLGLDAEIERMDMPGMPPADMGSVATGDSGLVIWSKHAVPPGQAEDTRAWVSGELGKGVLFTVGVPNAKKLWDNAQAMRAEVDQPLEAQPWGGHAFTVVDPDGYVVSFTDKFPGPPPKPRKRAKAKATGKSAKKGAKKAASKAKRR